jgi:hypothetical protein
MGFCPAVGQNLIVRTFWDPMVCAFSEPSIRTMCANRAHSLYMAPETKRLLRIKLQRLGHKERHNLCIGFFGIGHKKSARRACRLWVIIHARRLCAARLDPAGAGVIPARGSREGVR